MVVDGPRPLFSKLDIEDNHGPRLLLDSDWPNYYSMGLNFFWTLIGPNFHSMGLNLFGLLVRFSRKLTTIVINCLALVLFINL